MISISELNYYLESGGYLYHECWQYLCHFLDVLWDPIQAVMKRKKCPNHWKIINSILISYFFSFFFFPGSACRSLIHYCNASFTNGTCQQTSWFSDKSSKRHNKNRSSNRVKNKKGWEKMRITTKCSCYVPNKEVAILTKLRRFSREIFCPLHSAVVFHT